MHRYHLHNVRFNLLGPRIPVTLRLTFPPSVFWVPIIWTCTHIIQISHVIGSLETHQNLKGMPLLWLLISPYPHPKMCYGYLTLILYPSLETYHSINSVDITETFWKIWELTWHNFQGTIKIWVGYMFK